MRAPARRTSRRGVFHQEQLYWQPATLFNGPLLVRCWAKRNSCDVQYSNIRKVERSSAFINQIKRIVNEYTFNSLCRGNEKQNSSRSITTLNFHCTRSRKIITQVIPLLPSKYEFFLSRLSRSLDRIPSLN